MKNYVIINGVNSLTITGLAISKLPSISKPPLRVMTEEINGRDGDLITELGYGAYDKELVIGLYGNYDINEVIGFFNQEGTIVFSNEDDKYYNFKIINQIDYEALIKFRTATISLHCQPFKYPLTETPEEITTEYVEEEGETLTLNDTKIAPLSIDLKGNTTQNGTPTPSSPIPVNVVSGDNEVVVCGKNLWDNSQVSNASDYLVKNETGFKLLKTTNGRMTPQYSINLNANTTYTISCNLTKTTSANYLYCQWKTSGGNTIWTPNIANGSTQFTPSENIIGVIFYLQTTETNGSYVEITNFQIEKGSTATTYEPYTSQNYPLYLGVENIFKNQAFNTTRKGITFTNDIEKINISGTAEAGTYPCIIMYADGSYTTSDWWATASNIDSTKGYFNNNNIDNIFTIVNSGTSTTTSYRYILGKETAVENNSQNINASSYKILNANSERINFVAIGMSPDQTYNLEIKIQLEKGNKANTYNEYGASYIELNKIGTYQDYIYKTDKWYLHKEVGKVVLNGSESWSYEGGRFVVNFLINALNTSGRQQALSNYFNYVASGSASYGIFIYKASDTNYQIYIYDTDYTTANDFKTWLGTHNTNVYYVLATPTDTEITNTTLINQLEALKGAMSYEGQTNISQVNNDLPFILKVKGTKEGSGEGIINNIGNIYAKPIIELEGTGNIGIYKNGTQYFEVDMSNDNEITIDTEKMEAYHNGVLKNRKVIGDYNKFTIDEGNNNIEITGELTKATISNYTRWL